VDRGPADYSERGFADDLRVRDERELARPHVFGDQDVKGPDRRSLRRHVRTPLAGTPRVIPVELQTGNCGAYARHVLIDALTLNAPAVHDERRKADVARRMPPGATRDD
jgi:hypothetical protein